MFLQESARGFRVIGVSKDDQDGPAIKQFIKEMGMTYPAGVPLTKESIVPYDTRSIPSTFLIDRQGNVRWAQEGWSQGVEAEMEDMVKKLLDE